MAAESLTVGYPSSSWWASCFLFALGTPLWQSRKTLHEWKDNSVLAKQLAACTHLSSTVLSYSNRKCKKLPFSRTADHNFVSPGDAPATITQCVTWMERQFNACQITRSMYLSIFNSFWVIRCLSQCVSPKKSLFLLHFCFPRGRPCRNHAKRCINEKTIQCLPNPSQHIYLQQFPSYSNRKCK